MEMNSQEIQAGIQSLEICNDVPEEDDMTKSKFFTNTLIEGYSNILLKHHFY